MRTGKSLGAFFLMSLWGMSCGVPTKNGAVSLRSVNVADVPEDFSMSDMELDGFDAQFGFNLASAQDQTSDNQVFEYPANNQILDLGGNYMYKFKESTTNTLLIQILAVQYPAETGKKKKSRVLKTSTKLELNLLQTDVAHAKTFDGESLINFAIYTDAQSNLKIIKITNPLKFTQGSVDQMPPLKMKSPSEGQKLEYGKSYIYNVVHEDSHPFIKKYFKGYICSFWQKDVMIFENLRDDKALSMDGGCGLHNDPNDQHHYKFYTQLKPGTIKVVYRAWLVNGKDQFWTKALEQTNELVDNTPPPPPPKPAAPIVKKVNIAPLTVKVGETVKMEIKVQGSNVKGDILSGEMTLIYPPDDKGVKKEVKSSLNSSQDKTGLYTFWNSVQYSQGSLEGVYVVKFLFKGKGGAAKSDGKFEFLKPLPPPVITPWACVQHCNGLPNECALQDSSAKCMNYKFRAAVCPAVGRAKNPTMPSTPVFLPNKKCEDIMVPSSEGGALEKF